MNLESDESVKYLYEIDESMKHLYMYRLVAMQNWKYIFVCREKHNARDSKHGEISPKPFRNIQKSMLPFIVESPKYKANVIQV